MILKIYFNSHSTYGIRKIYFILRKEGIVISRKTVQNYMRELNIKSIVYKKFKVKKSFFKEYEYKNLKNHIKDLAINDINQVWTQDITYLKLKNGSFAYLASVIDLYSRKVIAYEVSKSMSTDLVIRVLKKAVETRKPKRGIIFHSDKGSQYRSMEYKNFCYEHNAIRSYTRICFSCADNAVQESFHATFKKECFYQIKPLDFEETKELVCRYIDGFYNPSRIHSSIKYFSPNEFEESDKKSKTCNF